MHFHQWKRREFIIRLGAAAATWPVAARAQQGDRIRRVGILLASAAGDSEQEARIGALRQHSDRFAWSNSSVTEDGQHVPYSKDQIIAWHDAVEMGMQACIRLVDARLC